MDIIRKEPEMFAAAKPVTPSMLAHVITDIEDKIGMIEKREITENQLLFAAQNLEQGYLEGHFAHVVVTTNERYIP